MKSSEKHQSVVKTKSLYFQIGLVISLFLTYYFIELEIPQNHEGVVKDEIRELPNEIFHQKLVIIKDPIAETKPEKQQPKESQKIKIIEREPEPERKEPDTTPIHTDTTFPQPLPEIQLTSEVPTPDIPRTYNTWELDENPSFPACAGLKGDAAKKCFNEQLQKFLKRNMRYPERAMASGNEGTILVNFVIDKSGKVTTVIPLNRNGKVSKELEQEATRLIGILPKMIPGKHGSKPVDVRFSIPISFKIY